eukprot:1193216-Prorocentrum_minimum.AAC.2
MGVMLCVVRLVMRIEHSKASMAALADAASEDLLRVLDFFGSEKYIQVAPGELSALGEVLFADPLVGLVGACAVELDRLRALIVNGLEHSGSTVRMRGGWTDYGVRRSGSTQGRPAGADGYAVRAGGCRRRRVRCGVGENGNQAGGGGDEGGRAGLGPPAAALRSGQGGPPRAPGAIRTIEHASERARADPDYRARERLSSHQRAALGDGGDGAVHQGGGPRRCQQAAANGAAAAAGAFPLRRGRAGDGGGGGGGVNDGRRAHPLGGPRGPGGAGGTGARNSQPAVGNKPLLGIDSLDDRHEEFTAR